MNQDWGEYYSIKRAHSFRLTRGQIRMHAGVSRTINDGTIFSTMLLVSYRANVCATAISAATRVERCTGPAPPTRAKMLQKSHKQTFQDVHMAGGTEKIHGRASRGGSCYACPATGHVRTAEAPPVA